MPEPMSDERLAEIRERARRLGEPGGMLEQVDRLALLAEVERLRAERDTAVATVEKVLADVKTIAAERDRLRAELAAFRPEPMSQRCRDGHHNGTGDWKCIGCHCLCHNRDAEVEQLQRSLDGWKTDAGTYLDNANFWRKRSHTAEAERDAAREQVKRVTLVRVWRNEDGKGFVFADDLCAALNGTGASDA